MQQHLVGIEVLRYDVIGIDSHYGQTKEQMKVVGLVVRPTSLPHADGHGLRELAFETSGANYYEVVSDWFARGLATESDVIIIIVSLKISTAGYRPPHLKATVPGLCLSSFQVLHNKKIHYLSLKRLKNRKIKSMSFDNNETTLSTDKLAYHNNSLALSNDADKMVADLVKS